MFVGCDAVMEGFWVKVETGEHSMELVVSLRVICFGGVFGGACVTHASGFQN